MTAGGGPLRGIRVLDLSTMVAGPAATQVLAEQGADVIKLEAPGGDVMRPYGTRKAGMSAWFMNTNRGKRSVVVDLDRPEGVDLVRRLSGGCDVVVQNFRPGVADRLGIGADALRHDHPQLIYVSISGFGDSGPYVHKRVYDPIIQAVSGLAATQADPATGQPSLIRSIIADKLTAATAAQAITAALFARASGAGGQHLQVNMLDAVVSFMWADAMMHASLLDDEGVTHMPNLMSSYRLTPTADGYVTIGAGTDEQFRGLWRGLGKPEVAEDERYRNLPERMARWGEVVQAYEAEAATWKTADLVAALDAEGVPVAPVLRGEEVLDDPQVRHNGTVEEVQHPLAGRLRQPRHPNRFDRTPVERPRHAPALGEHTEEILAEMGVPADERQRLREAGIVA